jgi:CRISPR-associated protein (TIGR02584 family)
LVDNTQMKSKTANKSPLPSQPRPKRILVCVTGLSPQIVTETVYALCVGSEPKWVPDEIRLITTQRGADNARLMLLSNQPGWFHRLCEDWKLPPIAFDESHITVIRSHNGLPLTDIRDDADNQAAADGIAEIIRQLTEDEHSEIHASIAGGRKTMGFFMGYAMSLWGRPQDKLSHVLVSSPFESRAEFFYPSPYSRIIAGQGPQQDPIDAQHAKVWLGHIPFVRLRSLLPAALKGTHSGFAQAVEAANCAVDQIDLVVDLAKSAVSINGKSVKLSPLQLGLMALLAWRCQKQLPPMRAPSKIADDPEWQSEALDAVKQIMGEMHIPNRLDEWLNSKNPMGDSFSQQLSRMEKKLQESGAMPLVGLIHRENIGRRGRQQGYRLNLQPARVKIIRYR